MEDIENAVLKRALTDIIDVSRKAAETIKDYEGTIRVISHYDADGISSAGIICSALFRIKKVFRLTILRQLEEEFIEELGKEKFGLYIITDMGSGQIENIQKHIEKARIIICDHHQMQGEIKEERIIHMNSLESGLGENISGAGVSYILARALDKNNTDLSELAIIGAIGDSQIDSVDARWGLNGMNKEILADSEKTGKIRSSRGLRLWGRYTRPLHKALEYTVDPYIPGVSGSESCAVAFLNELDIPVKKNDGSWRTISDLSEEEQKKLASGIIVRRINGNKDNPEEIFGDVYELISRKDEFMDANEFATMLNSCGKTGNASLGVRLCLNDDKAYDDVRRVLSRYRSDISRCVRLVQKDISEKNDNVIFGKGIYVLTGKKVPEDIISNVMSIVNHSHLVPTDKPLFGFSGGESSVKVSARLDKSLTGGPVNLKEIVSEAAIECGGEGGGHAGASGARIPTGTEDKFINIIEEELENIEKRYDMKEKNININNTINEDMLSDE